MAVAAPVAHGTPSDSQLVAAVRAGDDAAFEELYRRYRHRIAAYLRRLVRDEARAEDVAQEAFFSALRRLRVTETEIAFKPWIYEIARNAAIDLYRRSSRAEEVSINADDLRPSDRRRLVGSAAPDSTLIAKERLEHLRCALGELSDTHHRVLVMREFEGLSYREIGERLELTRPAVESTLFRARRRLEHEYEEVDTGRRCETMEVIIGRLADGIDTGGDSRRLARHARLCSTCRRRARELGVEPLSRRTRLAAKAAALFPLPAFLRTGGTEGASSGGRAAGDQASWAGPLFAPGAEAGAAVAERIAALAAAVALAGAGSAVLNGAGPFDGQRDAVASAEQRVVADGARVGSSGAVTGETGPRSVGSAQRGRAEGARGAARDRDARGGPRDRSEGPAAAEPDQGASGAPGTPGLPSVPDLRSVEPPSPPPPSGGTDADEPRLPDVPDLPEVKIPSVPPNTLPLPRVPDASSVPRAVRDLTAGS